MFDGLSFAFHIILCYNHIAKTEAEAGGNDMREYIVSEKDAGKRLDRWMQHELPALPMGLRQK